VIVVRLLVSLLAAALLSTSAISLEAKPIAPKKPVKAPPLDCGEMSCVLFDSPGAAFSKVLEEKPLILSVGEVHQTNETIAVRSALKRFTESMLPLLRHRASHLIAETWITQGECGEEEKQAVEEIEETTQRPAQTEDELVTLLTRARDLYVLPYVLEVSCDQYATILTPERELDEEKVLKLVTTLLLDKTRTLFERNQERGSQRMVVIYGGAMHNDVEPSEDYAAFSYGKDLDAIADGRYIELDLYVPELIAGDTEYQKEPWFAHFVKHVSTKKTLLIRTRPSTFLLIFPKKK
jgi:hypothetical protein